jgi:hypothetical protein
MGLRKVEKLTGLPKNYLNRLENKLKEHPDFSILEKISFD